MKGKATRKPDFSFPRLRIPMEAKLVCIHDESITAKVVGDILVDYEGENMRLSKAAGYACDKAGCPPDKGRRTPLRHWMYEGEKLQERRNRMNV